MTRSKTPTDQSTDPKAAEFMPGDAEFVAKTEQLLRESEAQVSPAQQQQLAVARRAAVLAAGGSANQGRRGWTPNLWLWAPAGAMAATVLTIALLWSGGVEPLPMLEPAEIAAAQELELLEDMEFLAWMLEQDDVGAG